MVDGVGGGDLVELVFFRGWRCRRGGLAQIARLRARVRPDEPFPDISKYVRQDFVMSWVSKPQICRAGSREEAPPAPAVPRKNATIRAGKLGADGDDGRCGCVMLDTHLVVDDG